MPNYQPTNQQLCTSTRARTAVPFMTPLGDLGVPRYERARVHHGTRVPTAVVGRAGYNLKKKKNTNHLLGQFVKVLEY